ncbi:MAG TPA: type II toxin-antitoxin system VapC family toxin, partial [Thermomicrobiales bacterium]|nr:type II toxin-antitoxin system VapC family toxin [Thermomicrobiales bacterium]
KVLLPVTKSIAERFGVLRGSLSRQTRDQVGDLDLLIASTAMVHDLTLPTRNQRDFQLIPGLNLYELHE